MHWRSLCLLWSFISFFELAITHAAASPHPTLEKIGSENDGYTEFCIVGAGPAGVQLAHHLQSAGANYIVIERNSAPGSFYSKFPRHEQLSKYFRSSQMYVLFCNISPLQTTILTSHYLSRE